MAKSDPKLGDMVPIDVRILDVGSIPSKYFLHDEVIEALHRVVRSDVIVHNNPVPPGAEAVFTKYTSGVARQRAAIATSELGRAFRRNYIGLITWLVFIGAATLIVALVWRWING